jgi:hypothetical protein
VTKHQIVSALGVEELPGGAQIDIDPMVAAA